jgi:hypothetical protein
VGKGTPAEIRANFRNLNIIREGYGFGYRISLFCTNRPFV